MQCCKGSSWCNIEYLDKNMVVIYKKTQLVCSGWNELAFLRKDHKTAAGTQAVLNQTWLKMEHWQLWIRLFNSQLPVVYMRFWILHLNKQGHLLQAKWWLKIWCSDRIYSNTVWKEQKRSDPTLEELWSWCIGHSFCCTGGCSRSLLYCSVSTHTRDVLKLVFVTSVHIFGPVL